jgi:hypothetical protein
MIERGWSIRTECVKWEARRNLGSVDRRTRNQYGAAAHAQYQQDVDTIAPHSAEIQIFESIAENRDVGIAKELTSEGTCSAPQVKRACVRTCRPSKGRRNRHYDLVMYRGSGRDQRQSARMPQTARDAD